MLKFVVEAGDPLGHEGVEKKSRLIPSPNNQFAVNSGHVLLLRGEVRWGYLMCSTPIALHIWHRVAAPGLT
jgi:hypothetical protein